jgi:flagellar biosynthesis protein FlhF
MIIKRYLVKDMNEAMTRIRYELGKDAIIVSQRKVKQSGIKGIFSPKLIEVTAALENGKAKKEEKKTEDESLKESVDTLKNIFKGSTDNLKLGDKAFEASSLKTKDNYLIDEDVKEMKSILGEILKNTKPKEDVDKFMKMVTDLDLNPEYVNELRELWENSEEEFREAIEKDINIFQGNIEGRVVVVGPTGVGKTTTIAKLAGRLALIHNKKVGLITIDTYRIGAVEQLRTYAEIMNIPFKVVITIKEMEEAIKEMEGLDVVLIDTTGRSSKNSMQISELRAFVQKAEPNHTLMVISSTTKNADITTILNGYKKLYYDKVVITKLDETTTYGAIHTILKESEKPLAYVTTGQNVPDDIRVPSKKEIINLIFGEETI